MTMIDIIRKLVKQPEVTPAKILLDMEGMQKKKEPRSAKI